MHCTLAGVFAAEAVSLLHPNWHILLSDTDVAPTSLFEVAELVRLGQLMAHNNLGEATPGIIVGTEPHLDVNAGLAIFPTLTSMLALQSFQDASTAPSLGPSSIESRPPDNASWLRTVVSYPRGLVLRNLCIVSISNKWNLFELLLNTPKLLLLLLSRERR